MSSFILTPTNPVADLVRPSTGKFRFILGDGTNGTSLYQMSRMDSTGAIFPLVSPTTYTGVLLANSAALTAADTLINRLLIPANILGVGETYRIRFTGQYAATVTNTVNFRARIGTLGTVADTLICTVLTATAGTVTAGFSGEILVTTRTSGAAGTIIGNGQTVGLPVGVAAVSNTITAVAVNTTVANFLSLTAGPSATSQNLTFTGCTIELVGLNAA